MIYTQEANCSWCVNYLGDRKCKAFPEHIPDELWSGVNPHYDPVEGDKGFLFKKKTFDFPIDY